MFQSRFLVVFLLFFSGTVSLVRAQMEAVAEEQIVKEWEGYFQKLPARNNISYAVSPEEIKAESAVRAPAQYFNIASYPVATCSDFSNNNVMDSLQHSDPYRLTLAHFEEALKAYPEADRLVIKKDSMGSLSIVADERSISLQEPSITKIADKISGREATENREITQQLRGLIPEPPSFREQHDPLKSLKDPFAVFKDCMDYAMPLSAAVAREVICNAQHPRESFLREVTEERRYQRALTKIKLGGRDSDIDLIEDYKTPLSKLGANQLEIGLSETAGKAAAHITEAMEVGNRISKKISKVIDLVDSSSQLLLDNTTEVNARIQRNIRQSIGDLKKTPYLKGSTPNELIPLIHPVTGEPTPGIGGPTSIDK